MTQEIPFTYGAHPNHCKAIKEKYSIALQRLEYIQHVRRYREEGRVVFYQAETRVAKNMTPPSVWLDRGGDSGVKVPSRTGMRSIVCHVGNEADFVPGAELIFRSKNTLQGSACHSEMNSSIFLDWLEKRVCNGLALDAAKGPSEMSAGVKMYDHRTFTLGVRATII